MVFRTFDGLRELEKFICNCKSLTLSDLRIFLSWLARVMRPRGVERKQNLDQLTKIRKENIMTYNTVIYRGAKTTLAEVNADLVKPAGKTSCKMQYRGAKGEVSRASHHPRKQKVTYRGATAIMEV